MCLQFIFADLNNIFTSPVWLLPKERNSEFDDRVPWVLFYFCCAQSICPLVRLLTSWNTTCHFQHPLSETSLWEYPEILAWPASYRENHTEYPASDKLLKHFICHLVQSVIDASTSNTTTGMRDFLWPPSHAAESDIEPLACRRDEWENSVSMALVRTILTSR